MGGSAGDSEGPGTAWRAVANGEDRNDVEGEGGPTAWDKDPLVRPTGPISFAGNCLSDKDGLGGMTGDLLLEDGSVAALPLVPLTFSRSLFFSESWDTLFFRGLLTFRPDFEDPCAVMGDDPSTFTNRPLTLGRSPAIVFRTLYLMLFANLR